MIYNENLPKLKSKIDRYVEEIEACEKKLYDAKYNLTRFDEFVKKRIDIAKDYELLEILRKTWSPTTGIPLIFIEGFMNSLLTNANKYLVEVWNNEDLVIDGFTIDEKNFFINIRRGYTDEFSTCDASKCSGAERATICSVLSLALLKQLPEVANSYNIVKFDEIDANLDYGTKNRFISIITELLDDIGCEQAFVCSHHDTFESNVDVILLKNSEEYESRILNGDYNIVYK